MSMTKIFSGELEFSVALTQYARAIAVTHIESIMRNSFRCEPPATVGLVCTVTQNEKIVGSLVLVDSKDNIRFPVEEHYEFDVGNCPISFNRNEIVQASRWTAQVPDASRLILRNAFKLAYAFGKRWVLIEAKPYSVRRLEELGATCYEIPTTTLLLEKVREAVGENGMSYYCTVPVPTLYLIEIAQYLGHEGL